jgi:hypothetical protein
MPLKTAIRVNLSAQYTKVMDLDTPQDLLDYAKAISLTTGVAVNQADLLFHDQRTLALSATEDLDLAGVLVDAFGAALTFVKVKAIILFAAAANANNVVISRPATNGFPLFTAVSSGTPVLPGGMFLWAGPGAGITVVPATGDLITITNGGAGTPVTYDIIIIGTSA